MIKTTKRNTTKTSIFKEKNIRNVIHAENFSESEIRGVTKLYNELVCGDKKRTIDIQMIITEAFPKFEETIGEEAFNKVKAYYGIGCRPKLKYGNEVRCLINKLRTIENAQFYIIGYKYLIQKIAEKVYNAPKDMTDLEKAKIMRMFLVIFANNEIFFEDYVWQTSLNGNPKVVFSEKQAVLNNKLHFVPEELFDLFTSKIKDSDGYYYDMMLIQFKKMYLEYNKYKNELAEVLEFSELRYDNQSNRFTSINICMLGASFAEIRKLKQRINKVHPAYPLELFCSKKLIEEKVDITDLYVIYKTLIVYPWESEEKTKNISYRSLCGSNYVDKSQSYYEVFQDFLISDQNEGERWIALFEYLAEYEIIIKTEVDGNGGILPEAKYYNVGILFAVLNYLIIKEYIDMQTMVIDDFTLVNKILALKDAEEIFLKFKRQELGIDEIKVALGISEEFERNLLSLKNIENEDSADNSLANVVIRFALANGYVESETDINVDLIENVFIPGNEENIKKYSNNEINSKEFEKRIGFDVEFAESYFDISKIDIKKIESKLLNIKQTGKNQQLIKNKLLVKLYCYLVKEGKKCGAKNKPAARRKDLKVEILERLIH